MKRHGVMLLIDGDNVSLDVMEQAIPWVAKHYGGPHVCRAYCTPESVVKHQQAFKRLGIRPVVNLAAGKNSTDIAMAIDALDLVLTELPEVVVIASSDSDFAPLVMRLREKGCRVVGIGQQGKTGEETQSVYDDFEVMVHHKSASSAAVRSSDAPARSGGARSTRARAPKSVDSAAAPAKPATKRTAVKKAVRAPRKTATASADVMRDTAPPAAPIVAPSPAPAAAPPALPRLNDEARAILQALPELARGGSLALNVAAERLRQAKVLSNRGSSTRLFAHYPDLFELEPAGRPSRVRAR
jgi:uncharacterized protein (TIGR00288 family)